MKKILAVILLCIILVLPACELKTEKNYQSQTITYSEPCSASSFNVKMEYYESKRAKYYFEPAISSSERETCIESTDAVLERQAVINAKLEIYIFTENNYKSKYISSHKLYTKINDWKSIDYVTDVLLALYGESAHYGTAFGYAKYLCDENGWKNNVASRFSNLTNKDAYDINMLCFDGKFTSADDISKVQGIASDFVNDYIDKNGENAVQSLLSSSSTNDGMKTMQHLLKNYYKNNGVTYDPSIVRYGYGGESYDYIVYSDFGTFYMENSWVDTNLKSNPLVYEGFLHSKYSDTKMFYETNIKQMRQYRDLFALGEYKAGLDIVFSKVRSASKYSFYQKANHRIYAYNIDSLMHEYIHAIAIPSSTMEQWQIEGFARYFSYYYDHYGIAFLNNDYNNTPDTAATKYVHEYLENIGRPINMVTDYKELENIVVYSRSFKDPNSSYVAGSSFVQFLVERYGESMVINHIYGKGEQLPVSYNQLVAEWNTFIENNYSNYSKYN